MTPPEVLVAAQGLLAEAWDLLRNDEGESRLTSAWEAHVSRLISKENFDTRDAISVAGHHQRDYGFRIGLLVGAVAAVRADGSMPTAAEAAEAVVEAAAWLDSEATERDWPREPDPGDDGPPSRLIISGEEKRDIDAAFSVCMAMRRAAETAVTGDATARATDLWRSINGVDLSTASPEQMAELSRVQHAATLHGRVQLDQLLDAGPPWWPW